MSLATPFPDSGLSSLGLNSDAWSSSGSELLELPQPDTSGVATVTDQEINMLNKESLVVQ